MWTAVPSYYFPLTRDLARRWQSTEVPLWPSVEAVKHLSLFSLCSNTEDHFSPQAGNPVSLWNPEFRVGKGFEDHWCLAGQKFSLRMPGRWLSGSDLDARRERSRFSQRRLFSCWTMLVISDPSQVRSFLTLPKQTPLVINSTVGPSSLCVSWGKACLEKWPEQRPTAGIPLRHGYSGLLDKL